MRVLFSFLSIAVFVFSCNPQTGNNKKSSSLEDSIFGTRTADTIKDFSKRFSELIKALQIQNQKKTDEFISPQFGLLIIESQGAMPFFHIASSDEVSFRIILKRYAAISAMTAT